MTEVTTELDFRATTALNDHLLEQLEKLKDELTEAKLDIEALEFDNSQLRGNMSDCILTISSDVMDAKIAKAAKAINENLQSRPRRKPPSSEIVQTVIFQHVSRAFYGN